jgi:hypothetical protein
MNWSKILRISLLAATVLAVAALISSEIEADCGFCNNQGLYGYVETKLGEYAPDGTMVYADCIDPACEGCIAECELENGDGTYEFSPSCDEPSPGYCHGDYKIWARLNDGECIHFSQVREVYWGGGQVQVGTLTLDIDSIPECY